MLKRTVSVLLKFIEGLLVLGTGAVVDGFIEGTARGAEDGKPTTARVPRYTKVDELA